MTGPTIQTKQFVPKSAPTNTGSEKVNYDMNALDATTDDEAIANEEAVEKEIMRLQSSVLVLHQ